MFFIFKKGGRVCKNVKNEGKKRSVLKKMW